MNKYQCNKCLIIVTNKFDYEPKCPQCEKKMRKIKYNKLYDKNNKDK